MISLQSPDQSNLNVAVIAGGPSAEAEVSFKTAEGVMLALQQAGCRPSLVVLDEDLPAVLQNSGVDVAFPVAHGPLGEDGCLQGLLEVVGIPYVGSGVRGSAVAADKPSAKLCFRAAGLPVAEQLVLFPDQDNAAKLVVTQLAGSVVVKPADGGSAIGVTRIMQPDANPQALAQIQTALRDAWANGGAALVERFCNGQEVTCGVIEDETGAVALPPSLIRPKSNDWYDFTSRYGAAGSEHLCPAPLEAEVFNRVQALAVAAHQAVGARDLSRVDFVVGDRTIVLEVNTLPGMTATSNYPEAAAEAGIPFAALCRHLVARAAARPRRGRPAAMPWPG